MDRAVIDLTLVSDIRLRGCLMRNIVGPDSPTPETMHHLFLIYATPRGTLKTTRLLHPQMAPKARQHSPVDLVALMAAALSSGLGHAMTYHMLHDELVGVGVVTLMVELSRYQRVPSIVTLGCVTLHDGRTVMMTRGGEAGGICSEVSDTDLQGNTTLLELRDAIWALCNTMANNRAVRPDDEALVKAEKLAQGVPVEFETDGRVSTTARFYRFRTEDEEQCHDLLRGFDQLGI